MTSKPSKKTNQKKAPAKKAPAKKAPASKKTSTPKDTDILLSKVGEEKPQFVSAEKMMKAFAETSTIITANDVKNKKTRRRMLAWFRRSK